MLKSRLFLFLIPLFVYISCFPLDSGDDSSGDSPKKKGDFKNNQSVVDFLNNATGTIDHDAFKRALASYSGNDSIYSQLNSDSAKITYVKALLADEPICSATYEPRETCLEPFVCAHFSLKMYLRYREDDVPASILTNTIEKYSTTQVEKKLRLPIHDVTVNIQKGSSYHAINAIKLNDKALTDPKTWLFLEPQRCDVLFQTSGYSDNSLVHPTNVYMVMSDYFKGLGADTGKWSSTNKYFVSLKDIADQKDDVFSNLVSFEVDDNYQLKTGVAHWKQLVEAVIQGAEGVRYDKAQLVLDLIRKHPSIADELSTVLDANSSYSPAVTAKKYLKFLASPELSKLKSRLAAAADLSAFKDAVWATLGIILSGEDTSSYYKRSLMVDDTFTTGINNVASAKNLSNKYTLSNWQSKGTTLRDVLVDFFNLGTIKDNLESSDASSLNPKLDDWKNNIFYPAGFSNSAAKPMSNFYRITKSESDSSYYDAKSKCSSAGGLPSLETLKAIYPIFADKYPSNRCIWSSDRTDSSSAANAKTLVFAEVGSDPVEGDEDTLAGKCMAFCAQTFELNP